MLLQNPKCCYKILNVVMSKIMNGRNKEGEKDAKGKNVGKTISSFFHYFEKKFQYRIERPPVITGGLKIYL